MPQIISITSEALQATIRRLLPSQQGFGDDLQATNLITPIIDLTPTAEGSEVRADLQTAMAFGSQTAWGASGSTATIANSGGFYRVFAGITVRTSSSADRSAKFVLNSGLSAKTIWELNLPTSGTEHQISENIDMTVFLAAGDSLTAVSDDAIVQMIGSVRQIADLNGNLVDPSGFTPQ